MRESTRPEATCSPGPGVWRSPYLDVGVLLALVSAAMYVLGWTYWRAFFAEFSIHFSLVDFSVERIMVTTWWGLLWVVWGIQSVFDLSEAERRGALHVRLPVGHFTTLLCLTTGVVLAWVIRPAWWVTAIAIVVVAAASATIDVLLGKKSLPIGEFVAASRFRLLLSLVIVFALAGIAYDYAGRRAARDAKTRGQPRVQAYLTNGNIPAIEGTLISHMGDRYFVWVTSGLPNAPCTYIVHDSTTASVHVWKPVGRPVPTEGEH